MNGAKKVVVFNDKGEALATFDVDSGQPATSNVPATLAWYKETTTWLVTLAVGAVVLGLGFFEKSSGSPYQRGLFLVAGVFLLGAILAGVLANMKIVEYGNRLEPTPVKDEAATRAHTRLSRYFRIMQVAFFVGIGVFALVGLVRIWTMSADERPSYSWIRLKPTSPPPAGVIVEEGIGAAWLVTNERAVRLEGPPSIVPSGHPVPRERLVAWRDVRAGRASGGVPLVWMTAEERAGRGLSPLPDPRWPQSVHYEELAGAAARRCGCDLRLRVCADAAHCKQIDFVYDERARGYRWVREHDSVAKGGRYVETSVP